MQERINKAEFLVSKSYIFLEMERWVDEYMVSCKDHDNIKHQTRFFLRENSGRFFVTWSGQWVMNTTVQ